MDGGLTDVLAGVERYYADCFARHGTTARGVDWNGEASQALRFEELARVLPVRGDFSVNDLGCGYGALLPYLASRFSSFRYHGWDIARCMVAAARSLHGDDARATFSVGAVPAVDADFGLASGIFNVRAGASASAWEAYVVDTLDALHRTSRAGFAFNCLTSYSDPPLMRPDLHYADPRAVFDLCKRRYSRKVALLHDYDLYEFTVLVRKSP